MPWWFVNKRTGNDDVDELDHALVEGVRSVLQSSVQNVANKYEMRRDETLKCAAAVLSARCNEVVRVNVKAYANTLTGQPSRTVERRLNACSSAAGERARSLGSSCKRLCRILLASAAPGSAGGGGGGGSGGVAEGGSARRMRGLRGASG